ncbi:DNA-directed RNA polymerase III subunit RPC5-like [Haliotis rufescens]|uniref:DNA-directed RNA polymerase III subunit RPC5-like n=1 Tax=Haliotis rufescens TaxID=6454 RepID=UPI001EAFE283|nr:DNA-directed RNA polymerase III subunit RPC5-like [Haliotis rufescens]
MADDDDPVEHEINVYLSKSLAQNLCLFQYPVRPAHMTYDSVAHLSARVKPTQKKVELELNINTRSPNYARSKGEQIALNVDGTSATRKGERFYGSDLMDKQVLTSSTCSMSTNRYAAGVLKDGELHLTPLHGLVQLRPGFSYLDHADTRPKPDLTAAGDVGDSSQDEMEEEAKPVTVKFARHESEEAKARRMASYEYLKQRMNEEPWVQVECHGIEDNMAESERLLLLATQGDDMSEFQMAGKDYMHCLMPPATEQTEDQPAMPNNVLSLSQLRTLPLPDQVRTLLTNVKVLRLAQLLALLPQGTDPAAVLRSLQQVAVLVQGCWVVKSEVLYPKEACSPHSGISSEILCRGRDYVMWKFTQSRHVVRKDVSSVIKLPAEDVKDILEQMSKVKANKGWEFVCEFDKEFTDRYTDIVQRQKMLWDAKYQALAKQFKIPKDQDKKVKGTEMESPTKIEKPRRRRTSSKSSPRQRTLSGRSVSDQSDIEMEPASKPGSLTREVTPVMTEPLVIHEEIHDSASNIAEQMEVSESDHVTQNGPISDDTNTSDTNNLTNGISTELREELLSFMANLLRTRKVFTHSEMKRLFALKLQMCPPGHVLGSGVSEKLLEDVVVEAGGMSIDNQWPPNTKPEPIYALVKVGDESDGVRKVLFDMFRGSCRVKTSAFKKKILEFTGSEQSDINCRTLLREYCETRGALWYLKGACPDS